MIKTTFDVCKKVSAAQERNQTTRTPQDVFNSLVEEVGELSTEVRVAYGNTYKNGDKDGILGESVDVISCALDMIYVTNPGITPEEVMKVVEFKLSKWLAKETGATWNNDYKIGQ